MTTMVEQDHSSCWSESFWIHHCEGFRVERPDGQIGVVEGVERGSNGEVEALLVRESGALHVVPVSHVESVEGWNELVTLRGNPVLDRA